MQLFHTHTPAIDTLMRPALGKLLLTLSLIATVIPSDALATPVVFSGSGTGTGGNAISAAVSFEFVSHDFGSGAMNAVEINLRNTAGPTTVRGNLITGLFFSLPTVVGNLPTTVVGFDGLAARVLQSNGTTVNNVDIAPAVNGTATDGGYQLSNGPFGNANNGSSFAAFRYGISTIGGGLTGFSGNATNSDDYGIAGSGSLVTSGNLGTVGPIIDSIATFWVKAPGGWTSTNQITGVRVTYGSLPDNFLDLPPPPTAVPEPSSLMLMGIGGLGALGWRRRRRV